MRSMILTIRDARPDELVEVGRVVSEAYVADGALSYDDPYYRTLERAPLEASGSQFLIAELDGRLVGSVTWCPPGSSQREIALPDEGEFRQLAVLPDSRGFGIARQLVEACLGRAKDIGLSAVVISSAPWMTTAHALYEDLGFVALPERDWSPRPEVELTTFRHDLS